VHGSNVHRELPITDEEKGGHAAHSDAPGVAEKVLFGHSEHGVKNMSGLLNLPGAHSVHCVAAHTCTRDKKTTRSCVRENMLY
jgi:hypothetical protein